VPSNFPRIAGFTLTEAVIVGTLIVAFTCVVPPVGMSSRVPPYLPHVSELTMSQVEVGMHAQELHDLCGRSVGEDADIGDHLYELRIDDETYYRVRLVESRVTEVVRQRVAR